MGGSRRRRSGERPPWRTGPGNKVRAGAGAARVAGAVPVGLVLRPATAADLDAVVMIERVSFSDPPWSRRSFASLLDDPRVRFTVACAAGGVAGAEPGRAEPGRGDIGGSATGEAATGDAAIGDAPPADAVVGYVVTWVVADEAELANLAVAPGRRRAGIGRSLLDSAIADVLARGATSLYLEVRESNVAGRAMYGGRGFVAVGRRPSYYRNPTEDALLLRYQPAVDRGG
jgi:[ribosomal protein S18]-alanine N-acetyltransferase